MYFESLEQRSMMAAAPGSIAGTLWNDGNGNGVIDAGESATANRVVYLDQNANARLDTGELQVMSDALGNYKFRDLAPGTYNVTRVFPSGYRMSNSKTGYLAMPVKAGQNRRGVNIGTIAIPTPKPVADAALVAQIPQVFNLARAAAEKTITALGNDPKKYVDYTSDTSGQWHVTNADAWTSGFWPGYMWQLYQYDKSSTWRDRAARWTVPLAGQASKTGDLAFRLMTTYAPLYEYTNDSKQRDVLLAAAASKNKLWNEKVGAFQTTWFVSQSGNLKANFAVLMDMTTDLELMFWAGKTSGNQQYIDRALRHFQTVSRYLVSPDGSTRHFALFDKNTGQFVLNETYQGYSNNSTWARGQAWAVLSFANTARDTGRADFLAAAQKVADYFLANLPADRVPFWDFNDPSIPNTFKDSSAASIAASGLIEIARLTKDATLKSKYQKGAEAILKSLISNYLITGGTQQGLLRHGSLDVPHRSFANDVTLVFGDYYFLQAVNRYRGLVG